MVNKSEENKRWKKKKSRQKLLLALGLKYGCCNIFLQICSIKGCLAMAGCCNIFLEGRVAKAIFHGVDGLLQMQTTRQIYYALNLAFAL
nr:hypothetical protein [Tanacetum cinerariifolium]